MDRKTFTLRLSNPDDPVVVETEITAEQALDLGAGKPIAYIPRDKSIAIDEGGRLIERESAVPVEQPPDNDPRKVA